MKLNIPVKEVPLKVPDTVMWTTHKDFPFIAGFLETLYSTTVWGMQTSATTALAYKRLLTKYALETVGNADFVPFQGHDFSFRGMFGLEAASMSGAAHLTSFVGTDTVPAITFLEDYYLADHKKELIGCSVPATEHAVACLTILDFVERVEKENPDISADELFKLADIEYVKHQ